MKQVIIDGFVAFRKEIKAWFEKDPSDKTFKGLTFIHYERGFEDGYKQRQKEEAEEMDAL